MLIAVAFLALPILSLFALTLSRWEWSHAVVYGGCFLVSLCLLSAGLEHLGGLDSAPSAVLPLGLPWMQAHIRIDNLSALFLIIINLSGAAASAFGIGYGAHLTQRRRVTPFFPLFLMGMNGVLIADDAFVFLVAWEFMSLASWLLVLSDHRNAENRRAAFIYLCMAAFGTFCLLPVYGVLAGPSGDYTFAAMRARDLSTMAGAAVVLLTILGTGSKAGLVPMHVWLPLAHPAAPSHVSALMSGVMTKVALYAMIRILFDLHGQVGWQWGALLMVIGGLTAVIGVLFAVVQNDIKVLLAYSTVENIGVAVIGLGLALAFKAGGDPALAALALVAGLYHILNHSIFKTLLFLGAGAVTAVTGERLLSRMGGLLNRLPITGICVLVGAAAASSLPPLNGFVSEWLTLQALFKGPSLPHWAMKFGVPVVGALLALAAALAASCFVRLYGIAFLGRPRSPAAQDARETGHVITGGMRLTLSVLAALCVALGAVPVTVTTALSGVVKPLIGVQFAVSVGLGWPWLSPVSSTRGSYSGTILVLTGVLLLGLAAVIGHRLGTRNTRRADAWDCGHPEDNPATQYGPASFSQPLRRVYGTTLFRARERIDMPAPGSTSPARHSVHMRDLIWEWFYARLGKMIDAVADRVNRLQYLTVRQYLIMMFAALIILLLVVAVRQQQ